MSDLSWLNPTPMQLLCTLRDHCRCGPRNTRYQADATPYLGRTSTGWIAPALPGALTRSPRRRGPARLPAHRGRVPCGLGVRHKFVFGRRLYWQVGRLFTLEDAIDVAVRAAVLFDFI